MNSLLSPRTMVGAAIVGLVSAAGVFIYEQVYAEKRRAMLVKEVAKLDKQVSSMKTELEALRELQKESQERREKQKKRLIARRMKRAVGDNMEKNYGSDSEYYTDYQSVIGTDIEMDSDQFFDVPSDAESDDTLRDTQENGQTHFDSDEESPQSNAHTNHSKKAT